MKKEWRKTPPPLWLSTGRRYIYTPPSLWLTNDRNTFELLLCVFCKKI